MGLTEKDLDYIRSFKESTDDENVRFKNVITKALLENKYIIHALDNRKLDEDDPDSYYLENIFPTFVLPNTIVDAENYICYDTKVINTSIRNNKIIKTHYIIFHVLCDIKNVFDKESGICRHDLICALIKDMFNWSQDFGHQSVIIEETPTVTDDKYSTRTITFSVETTNSIARGPVGASRVINR